MESQTIKLEETIRSVVAELLAKMGVAGEIEVSVVEEDGKKNILCNIKTEESNFLIGQYGVNLQSLQHIARVLVRKKTAERANFVLDVNQYRQEKNSSIIKLAKSIAEQALVEKRAVVLRPMSPYERRLVHMELSKNPEVRTESIGEGEDRKVVVKPANLI